MVKANWRCTCVWEDRRLRLDGFGCRVEGRKLAVHISSFIDETLGKLRRGREARAKRERAFGPLFKSQERSNKVASRLASFPTHGILHIFCSNAYLAFYSDLYPKGYTYPPLYTGLRINEDMQK